MNTPCNFDDMSNESDRQCGVTNNMTAPVVVGGNGASCVKETLFESLNDLGTQ